MSRIPGETIDERRERDGLPPLPEGLKVAPLKSSKERADELIREAEDQRKIFQGIDKAVEEMRARMTTLGQLRQLAAVAYERKYQEAQALLMPERANTYPTY